MNDKTELKILQEFLKLVQDPTKAEKRFRRYGKVLIFVSVLLLFFCLSDNVDLVTQHYLFLTCAFLAGALFGLGLWFLQAGIQTGLMAKHMSVDSINSRISEIKN